MEQFQIDAKTTLIQRITADLETPVVEKPRPRRNEMSQGDHKQLADFLTVIQNSGDDSNYLMANNDYPNTELAIQDLG